MREIKFRTWDKKNNNMLFDNPYVFIDCNSNIYFDVGLNKYEKINKKNFILMQFTGLKDKNGKEIYEGDILKVIDDQWEIEIDSVNGKVEWITEWGYYNVTGLEDGLFELDRYCILEVIGNIHENPELLK